jgi:hypothetical protein
MTTISREFIAQALAQMILMEPRATVNTSYSGRGMYGQECLAFHVSKQTTVATALTIASLQINYEVTPAQFVQESMSDNLGLGYVIYFPAFQAEAE